MCSPKVSVIVPVCNVEAYLHDTVKSLLNQTLQDIEIICIDDGSVDKSLEILNFFAEQDSRIKVFHFEKSRSTLSARIKGLEEASGQYIMFLDGDDTFTPDACQTAYDSIVSSGTDILSFPIKVVAVNSTSEEAAKRVEKEFLPFNGTIFEGNVLKGCFIDKKFTFNLQNKIYKTEICKKALKDITDTDIYKAEDLYMFFIIAYYAESYSSIMDKKLYIYYWGRGITKRKNDTTEAFFRANTQARALKEVSEFCQKYSIYDTYRSVIESYELNYLKYAINVWQNELPKNLREEGLKIMCDLWGAEKAVNFIAQRYWDDKLSFCDSLPFSTSSRLAEKDIRTVAFYYTRYTVGGVERVLSLLMPEFLNRGYNVVLITDEYSETNEYTLPAGVKRCFIYDRNKTKKDNFYARLSSWKTVIEENNVDVVLYSPWSMALNIWDILYFKMIATPVIVHTHNVFAMPMLLPNEKFTQLVRTLPYSDAIVTLSGVDKMFWETFNDNVYYIPNPVAPELFSVKHSAFENKAVVWCGRDSAEKNPEAALKIMRKVVKSVPDAKLYMVGISADSPWHDYAVRNKIENNIVFTGYVSNVYDYMSTASVHLMTSRYEGFPMVKIEAQAHYLPTVSYILPHLEMFRDEFGTVSIEQNDIDGAADEIIKLLTDNNYWNELSSKAENGDNYIKNFDIIQAWVNVLSGKSSNKLGNDTTYNLVRTFVNFHNLSRKTESTDFSLSLSPGRLLSCLKEHGLVYTLKLILKRLK